MPATESYYAVISLQNIGVWNYIRVNFYNSKRNTHTIFGCDAFDKTGVPTNFNNMAFARSNLHEYIHAVANQLIDKNILQLQQPAKTILTNPKVWEKVQHAFYNTWQFILYESLVRACSIKYLSENNEIETTLDKEIAEQEKAGFFWMRGLTQQLDVYANNRDKYKSLVSFMPEIKIYFEKISTEMKDGKFIFPGS